MVASTRTAPTRAATSSSVTCEFAIDDPRDFVAGNESYLPSTAQDAEDAYESVLETAGAFPRDLVTTTAVQDVADRSGSWEQPSRQICSPNWRPLSLRPTRTVTAWPTPGEQENGLDPSDGDDHRTVMDSGYTAIEQFVNKLADELVGAAARDGDEATASPDENSDDEDGDATAASGRTLAAVALALSIVASCRSSPSPWSPGLADKRRAGNDPQLRPPSGPRFNRRTATTLVVERTRQRDAAVG